jgi:hypothetical protein
MTTPHDNLFHFTFGKPGHAAAWIAFLLPPHVTDAIDWASLRTAPERIDGHDLRLHMADLVHRGALHDGPYINFLSEHCSADARALTQKVMRYAVHLGREGDLLLAFVLYHGDRPWRANDLREGSLRRLDPAVAATLASLQLEVHFVLDDLSRYTELVLRARPLPPMVLLTLLSLRFLRTLGEDAALAAIERWGDLLHAADRDPSAGPDAVDCIACYVLRVTDIPPRALHIAFERILQRPEETIMSTAEKLLKEGEARGEARGQVRGETLGVARRLLMLLEKRFGPVPAPLVERVQLAELPLLDRWFDRVLDVATLEELFA